MCAIDRRRCLARCVEFIREQVALQGLDADQILGIGVGVPGPVDFARGVLVAPPLMPGWENFPIRSFFKEAFPSAYVVVDNDVNIMALGEQRAGEGFGRGSFYLCQDRDRDRSRDHLERQDPSRQRWLCRRYRPHLRR